MSNAFLYLLLFLGIFSFSFVSWRSLREDYSSEKTFSCTVLFLLGGLAGWTIFNRWLPEFAFWGALGGSSIFGFGTIFRMNFRFFEVLDALAVGFLWLTLFLCSAIIFRQGQGQNFTNLYIPVIAAVTLLTYQFFLKHYRRFSWYPSGKIGFIGGMSIALFFFFRMLVDFVEVWMLSSQRAPALIDASFSLLISGVFLSIVYIRSERRNAQRFVVFFEKKKKRKK